MKGSPINYRALYFVSATVLAAVFCCYVFTINAVVGIVAFALCGAAVLLLLIITCIRFSSKSVKARKLFSAILAVVVFVSALFFGLYNIHDWNRSAEYGGIHSVSGRVCGVYTREGDYRIDLDDVNIDGIRVNGIMRVKIRASNHNIAEIVDYGDRLAFHTFVTARTLNENGSIDGTAYRSNIRYYATQDSSKISVMFGKPKLTERFMSALNKLLNENMGGYYGALMFSMITGDKHALDGEVTDLYSVAGLGHIMAVSGLHIGFLIMLINLLLSRIDKRVRYAVITAVLIFYMMIADFSPSVVRASIMAFVTMVGVMSGARRDILSSMLLAFSIILAIKPFYLFEAGFLLSFGALYGIALFSNTIRRTLTNRKLPDKISSGVGTAVSVRIGILPSEIYFFKRFSVFSLIVNIVLIPYMSLVFTVTVCLLLIAFIPHFGAILILSKYMLVPIDYLVRGIYTIPFAQVNVFTSVAVYLCYPIMFFMSGFFMMPKSKALFNAFSVAVCFALCIMTTTVSGRLIAVPNTNSNTSIVIDDNNAYLVGEIDDAYVVREQLLNLKRTSIEEVYLFYIDEYSADCITELSKSVKIGRIYCREFSLHAERLVKLGFDFRLTLVETGAFDSVYDNVGFVGYEYKNALFAQRYNGYPANYAVIRVKTTESTPIAAEYLCNYADDDIDAYTLINGAYSYAF